MPETILPKFDEPPVVETVLGVQFSPLEGFSAAHVGWFWKNHLDTDWTKTIEVPRLPDQFERFGDEKAWKTVPGIHVTMGVPSNRTQLVRADDERMIQVQNTRFIYNWRKRKGEYPSYDKLRPEFDAYLDSFRGFAREAEFGELSLNQWEVTYVNHLPRGEDEVWKTIEDWADVFPDVGFSASRVENLESNGMSGNWQFSIGENRGRLYASVKYGRMPDGLELAVFQLTARGPVDSHTDFGSGFELGHKAIVRSFAEMTSSRAHEIWKRTV